MTREELGNNISANIASATMGCTNTEITSAIMKDVDLYAPRAETPAAIAEMREALEKIEAKGNEAAFAARVKVRNAKGPSQRQLALALETFAEMIRDTARAALALPAGRVDMDQRTSEGGWQPIETAPKDGTPLMFCYSNDERDAAIPIVSGYWSRLSDDWFSILTGGKINPTHWQPLPTSPSQSTAQGGEG